MPLFQIICAAQNPSHCVAAWALRNPFAILTGNQVHHMNLRPSILGFLDHMRYWGEGGLVECRGFFRASGVRNSVTWSHPRVASPGRKTWQHFSHTKAPEPFPGLQTILRKLHFPAKFTTPCQSLVPSCCLRSHYSCLAHLPRSLVKDGKGWSCVCFHRWVGMCYSSLVCERMLLSHTVLWMITRHEAACEGINHGTGTKSWWFASFCCV